MFTKITRSRKTAGIALVEVMIASGILAILLVTLVAFSMFSARSFATLFNYVDLDAVNKNAIDQITRDVRQSNRVKEATATKLVLEDSDGADLTYEYSAGTRTLKRTKNSVVRNILTECDRLSFELKQRNTVSQSFEVYDAATADTAKVVNVSWLCSRTLFGRKENTESVQTARIVIRKQGT